MRTFLLGCFAIPERELFVCHDDQVNEKLRNVPRDVRFSAFCAYREVFGHFAMRFSVGIEGRLVDRVGREEFAERFAAHFDTSVVYGADGDPPGVDTVILADGTRLRAAIDENENRFELYAATAPVPGLPEVPVDEGLWWYR